MKVVKIAHSHRRVNFEDVLLLYVTKLRLLTVANPINIIASLTKLTVGIRMNVLTSKPGSILISNYRSTDAIS